MGDRMCRSFGAGIHQGSIVLQICRRYAAGSVGIVVVLTQSPPHQISRPEACVSSQSLDRRLAGRISQNQDKDKKL
jgi:hypothetical protein